MPALRVCESKPEQLQWSQVIVLLCLLVSPNCFASTSSARPTPEAKPTSRLIEAAQNTVFEQTKGPWQLSAPCRRCGMRRRETLRRRQTQIHHTQTQTYTQPDTCQALKREEHMFVAALCRLAGQRRMEWLDTDKTGTG